MKKPWYMLFVGLILLITMVGCGETVTPEKADTAAPKPQPPKIFSIGEQIKMGGQVLIMRIPSICDTRKVVNASRAIFERASSPVVVRSNGEIRGSLLIFL